MKDQQQHYRELLAKLDAKIQSRITVQPYQKIRNQIKTLFRRLWHKG